jgi:RNA polymerase sigma-70 factor (ECF subfamily)
MMAPTVRAGSIGGLRKGIMPVEMSFLLARAAEGDAGAFEQIYEQVAGPVYGLALRVLGDQGRAEETAQGALVEVWRTAARFDPAQDDGLAWALATAHRYIVDRARADETSPDRLARLTSVPRTDPDPAAALSLAYHHGCTTQEVAVLLGIPVCTVQAGMRDGLISVRDRLGIPA